jgi:hypothetical protein
LIAMSRRPGPFAISISLALVLGLVPCALKAQQNTQFSGSFTSHDPEGSLDSASFTCFNAPTCKGRVSEKIRGAHCSDSFSLVGDITITGLNVNVPASATADGEKATTPLTLDVTMEAVTIQAFPNGSCNYNRPGPSTFRFTGTWDGTTGRAQYVSGATITELTFKQTAARSTPPLTVGVSGFMDSLGTFAEATVRPRPEDVGTLNNVYVFARAPSTLVRGASAEKDTPVQCVLAQLNASNQLQAVNTSTLRALVTNVLTAQGQAVTVLNGVPTSNVAGATFFVGYGTSGITMLNNNTNQPAVRVPGVPQCDPQPPQTGWWWNPAEGGRGYSIEVAGNHIFFASYLYDVSGRATWLVASGNTQMDGSVFTGNLEAYAGGQTLGGAYKAPSGPTKPGEITLAFNDATTGTMIWPGGAVAIERFSIVPNGVNLAAQQGQPESGWWWNPSESGRGFFLEWQGGELFMAGYMYDDQGSPIWYLGTNTSPSTNLQAFSSSWWQFANGATLTGPYKPAQRVNDNVAPVTITFSGSENAIMTLPGGRTTALRRFRF